MTPLQKIQKAGKELSEMISNPFGLLEICEKNNTESLHGISGEDEYKALNTILDDEFYDRNMEAAMDDNSDNPL